MFRCLRTTRKTSRPLRSIYVRSYKYHSSRSPLLPQRSHLCSLLHYTILGTTQALRFHRRYPLGWRLGYSFREYRPICQGNEYPASRWNTYSADTFDASKSRFPTHLEMHSSRQPSNELIRYVRRCEHELRLDSRNTSPRWLSERDVMKAACIVFLLRYEPNKERREDRLKEVLKALKTGLRVDSRSSRPRWNAIQRRNIKKLIIRMERTHAFEVAAVNKNRYHEWEACSNYCCLVISMGVMGIFN